MSENEEPKLNRAVGVTGATTLNMIDMIGVGPFITMPLIIAAMGGPQAMLGWIFGALLVICDGLVWAELGASMPKSGGPYNYLKEIYGANKLGRLMSFIFIWQLTFSAPLSIASGSIGFAGYATYAFPSLNFEFFAREIKFPIPLLGDFTLNIAIGVVAFSVFLLYRKITIIEKFSKMLWVAVLLTIVWIIFAGLTNFNSE